MKRFFTILFAGLLIAAIAAPALAWEFDLKGESEFRFRYFARQGDSDLFGGPGAVMFNGLQGNVIGFAGPVNNTVLVQGFSAKGADASIADERVWLYPEIRVNPAIRLRGEYWVTGTNLRGVYDGTGINTSNLPANNWTNDFGYNGWHVQSDMNNANGTTPAGMSIGMWEKWWMTAQTPWGIVAVGRRPFPFGTGWSTLHEKDANTETWLIVVPYGPMRFLFGQGLRTAGDTFCVNSIPIVGVANTAPAFPQAVNALNGALGTDKNRIRPWDGAVALVYNNANVEFGSIPRWVIYWDQHFLPTNPAGPAGREDHNQGPLQGLFLGAANPNTGLPIYGDIDFVLWDTYFKYQNGRFFLNADWAFEWADVPRKGGRPVSVWADSRELEIGVMAGPSKVSAAYFYHSGDDRRGGLLDTARAFGDVAGVSTSDKFTRYLVFGGAKEAFAPYGWLIGIYGAGNNSFDARGYCTYNDFEAWAARLDYAVASNLNVFGSWAYMNRASNTGTPVAGFRGGVPNAGAGAIRVSPTLAGGAVPNVPDNYLGWEANAGVDWKLLENMMFHTQFGYWQPGDWFKYAYVDYTNLNTISIGGLAGVPINPNRGIDPIIGFQGSLVIDF